MKNKSVIFIFLLIVLIVGFGCGMLDSVQKETVAVNNSNAGSSANKSVIDNAIDTAVGGEKIGVQECDELYDYVGDLITKGENEDYVTRAARQYFLDKIRKQVTKSVEENKNDKVQMAKDCKDYRRQIDAFIKREPDNTK